MIVILSINLWTKYCDGWPVEVLFDKAWYADLAIFVKGTSTLLSFLKLASKISSAPLTKLVTTPFVKCAAAVVPSAPRPVESQRILVPEIDVYSITSLSIFI